MKLVNQKQNCTLLEAYSFTLTFSCNKLHTASNPFNEPKLTDLCMYIDTSIFWKINYIC